ncbi:hypothetical protein GCM10028803_37700 [Larkinella knui]|uniref:type II toxin-antitoxin system RelE/ParE family toxin n=1 Tax=Larkinella knui TaxID=2025310 RepID=UPI001E3A8AD9|nr:type II toxin-antitoxin system RelE/ParE family toxin [Larkinella knui]
MIIAWSAEAKEEVKDIYSYLLDEAPVLADDWADELENKLKLITDFPEMGRKVPEFYISFIREVVVGRYRLV